MSSKPTLEDIEKEYPFQHHYLELGVRKIRMHYLDEGHGPVLLMLHAFPMWSFGFRKLVEAFSKKYRVIVPDHIGYGLSDKPKNYDYRVENHINNLEILIDTLGLKDISLILHGLGGTIGAGYTVRHSKQISRIVMMNAIAFSGFKLPWRLAILKIFPWLGRWLLIRCNLLFAGLFGFPPAVRKGYRLPYYACADRIALLRFVNDIPCNPDDASYESAIDIEYDLWQMRDHRMCLIWAMDDWLYPEKYLRRWRQFCPEARVYPIRHAGRYITEDAPHDLIAIIDSFMKVKEP